MSITKKILQQIEKRYSLILLIISFLIIILIALFYWNLYSTIILKKVEVPQEKKIDEATLEKVMSTIQTRFQNYLDSTAKQYKRIF